MGRLRCWISGHVLIERLSVSTGGRLKRQHYLCERGHVVTIKWRNN